MAVVLLNNKVSVSHYLNLIKNKTTQMGEHSYKTRQNNTELSLVRGELRIFHNISSKLYIVHYYTNKHHINKSLYLFKYITITLLWNIYSFSAFKNTHLYIYIKQQPHIDTNIRIHFVKT